jgi:hypothetical protein
MSHWIAIGKVPIWSDLGKFTADLRAPDKWRVNPRTTITTVMALADGRVLAECHAHSKADFETWLKQTEWELECVTQISHIAKTGDIWKLA